jgi:hypothetical protein
MEQYRASAYNVLAHTAETGAPLVNCHMFSPEDLRRYNEPEFVVEAFGLPKIATLPCAGVVRIVVQPSFSPETIITIEEDLPDYRIQIVTSRESVWASIPKRISRPYQRTTYEVFGHFAPACLESHNLTIPVDEFKQEYPHLDRLFRTPELRDEYRAMFDGIGARLSRKKGDFIETVKLSNPEGENAEIIREAQALIEKYTHFYSQREREGEAKRGEVFEQLEGKDIAERIRLFEEAKLHNKACLRLARQGLVCPRCGHSRNIRFIEETPPGRSYFICQACGGSFDASAYTLL